MPEAKLILPLPDNEETLSDMLPVVLSPEPLIDSVIAFVRLKELTLLACRLLT